MKSFFSVLLVGLLGLLALAFALRPTQVHSDNKYGRMPIYFIENHGQLDESVAYYIRARDKQIYFTAEGLTFVLTAPRKRQNVSKPSMLMDVEDTKPPLEHVVKLDFLGANPNVRPIGENRMKTVVSYFKGSRDEWHTGLPTFGSVIYKNLWPGIDLLYSGTTDQLKYEFLVQPHADPRRIRLAYRGASEVKLNQTGELEISTPAGGFQDKKPHVYQGVKGDQVEVSSAYVLEQQQATDTVEYSFKLGQYDSSRPLVIDPAILAYSGIIGGSGYDYGRGVAVDSAGQAYVTGYAGTSPGFPSIAPGSVLSRRGDYDAFVVKVNADGTGLAYVAFIGGSDFDKSDGIAVSSSGEAYIVGSTRSTDLVPRGLNGPDSTYNGGSRDAFVAKLNASGTDLVYAGYIGGSDQDEGRAIAINAAGQAFVVGGVASNQLTFPVTLGPDTTYNGGGDAFVAKLSTTGTIVFAGYIGGSCNDEGIGVAVDSSNNVYVVGTTCSSPATFPVSGGMGSTYGGGTDGFIYRLNASGTTMLYSRYIGGAGDDYAWAVAVDSSFNAYVAGTTGSNEATFPVTVGPDLTYNGGWQDAMVAKVNMSGALVYAGYIGGAANEEATGIVVGPYGHAYVTGYTESSPATFPDINAPTLTYKGVFPAFDAFVAAIWPAGSGLAYCGYIGGDADEFTRGIAIDAGGNTYIAGETYSSNFTRTPYWPFSSWVGGTPDVFVSKIQYVIPY